MAALTYNGITLASRGLEETPEYVGDQIERGVAGDLDENFVAVKPRFTTTIVPQTQALIVPLRKYLEGIGQSWRFASDTYSFLGEGPAAGGTYTQSSSGGDVSGGKVNVGSGSFLSYDLAAALGVDGGWVATQGWTLGVRKVLSVADGGDGATWHRFIATGNVAVTQGSAANPAGVTQYKDGSSGSFSMGNWISVDSASSGLVKIHGKDNSAANAAYDYCDLFFLPYQLDSSWISALDTFLSSNLHPQLRRGVLSGAQLEEAITVRIRATSIKRHVRLNAGAHDPGFRDLALSIWKV